MRIGWTRSVILSVGLLILTAACQPTPYPTTTYQGGYAQPVRYAPGYDRCGSRNPCGQSYGRDYGRVCPPGHRLIRLPYSTYGQPGRACAPVVRRHSYRYAAASAPTCDSNYRGYAPRRSVYKRSYYRDARRRPIKSNSCCY